MARHGPSLAGRHHDIALESFEVVRPGAADDPVVVSVRALEAELGERCV